MSIQSSGNNIYQEDFGRNQQRIQAVGLNQLTWIT